jgi:hypothetical protein
LKEMEGGERWNLTCIRRSQNARSDYEGGENRFGQGRRVEKFERTCLGCAFKKLSRFDEIVGRRSTHIELLNRLIRIVIGRIVTLSKIGQPNLKPRFGQDCVNLCSFHYSIPLYEWFS